MINLILYSVVLFFTGLSSFFISRYLTDRLKENRTKVTIFFLILSVGITLLMLLFFGCTAVTLKGIIISLIFLTSSYQDIKTHECDDYIHPMILVTGFIGMEVSKLPNMIISAIIVFVIMMGSVIMTKSEIGGADIKFSVACAFVLGIKGSLCGLIIGLTLAVIINSIKKTRWEGFAMIPYLAVGFMTAYFI